MRTPSISVVVPTLNEVKGIASFLGQCRAGDPREILVVDGGSEDGTREAAADGADRVLHETGGLARQLNRGAAEAAGEILFFPYADTVLPDEWGPLILATLAEDRVVGGAFRLAFESDGRGFRFMARVANWRTGCGVGPLGDQAIFVERSAFEAVGGYRPEALLEDLDFVRRLRREGQVQIAPCAVRSSIRRYEQRGTVPTALRNWGYIACHYLGLNGRERRAAYRSYRSEH